MRSNKNESSIVEERSASQPFPIRFRQDLAITSRKDASGNPSFLISDPETREAYNFGEQEYFLCQAMDGVASSKEIAESFELKFAMPIAGSDLQGLGDYLLSLKLAVPAGSAASGSAAPAMISADDDEEPVSADGRDADGNFIDDDVAQDPTTKEYRYPLFNPERYYDIINANTRWLRPLIMLANFLLYLAAPVAFYIYFSQSEGIAQDLKLFGSEMSYLGSLLFILLTVNFIRTLVQGTVITGYGLRVKQYGIRLEFGMIPHFFISKNGVARSSRSAKLWVYGTSLLVRLHIFTAGVFLWVLFHKGQGLLPTMAIVLAQSGLMGLIILLTPHRQTDGSNWLANFFGWGPKVVMRAMEVFLRTVKRQPIPTSVSTRQRNVYFVFILCLFCVWAFIFIKVTGSIASGLEETFPGIFGRMTPYFFGALVLYMMFRFIPHKIAPVQRKMSGEKGRAGSAPGHGISAAQAEDVQGKDHTFLIVVGVICVILLMLPFPYRPGGEIDVLPPLQQAVQATIPGKITKVFVTGGDGSLVKKGTPLAVITSVDLENNIFTLQDQISARNAQLGRQKAELAKLLSGSRREDVDSARSKLEQASEQRKIALKELSSSQLTADYSKLVFARVQKLFAKGGLSELDVEEARKKADISAVDVEKAERTVASMISAQAQAQAELDKVVNGAVQQDIEAAKQDVEGSEAEVRKMLQQMKYAEQQKTDSSFSMPFDGYLAESYLLSKEGTYLKAGETFATAQTKSKPLVEVKLPEYETGRIETNAKAEVKLWVNPGHPYTGKVLSIEPSSTETVPGEGTRIFRVRIELDASTREVRPGMTGYGKITAGYDPLIVLITRPIIRFIKIEAWSWLP